MEFTIKLISYNKICWINLNTDYKSDYIRFVKYGERY